MQITNFDKKYSKQLTELWLSPEITKNTLSTKNKTTIKNINKKFSKEKLNSFLAIEQEILIGFASIRPFEGRRNHSADCAIFISQEFYGTGLAQKLMKKIFSRAKKLKLKRLELSVFNDNKRAIKFYEKIGFFSEGLKKNSLQRDKKLFDELLMAKLL